jgi:predicted nucleotidyltransferase
VAYPASVSSLHTPVILEHGGQPVAVGYFGSYARGDWGVGSDLDLVVLVAHCDLPFAARASHYDALALPVPVDLLVYTQVEWDRLEHEGRRLTREVRWVAGR